MNWGYRIAILYTSFVIFMITMVVMTFQYKVNLVAPDYYKQEMTYQSEIDKISNVAQLLEKVKLQYTDKMLWLELPNGEAEGEILFFRPSDASKDFKIALSTDSTGRQALPTEGLATGLWRLKIDWTAKGKAFYSEQRIKINAQNIEILNKKLKPISMKN
jgi:hypothetical protein